jgi:hypothetical protein
MFLTGQMAQYVVVIEDLDFNAQAWQCWLLVVAFCAEGAFRNTIGARYLASLELAQVVVTWHIAAIQDSRHIHVGHFSTST